ncbi:MAG: serine/threonine-protein kinase [Polyangiales bacterium]
MSTDERSELRGTVLDGLYRIGPAIGVGGTSVVFESTRLTDGATVVVKTLRPMFAHHADLERRLRREAEVARRVPHPGIVPVRDVGLLPDGSPYIVLERMHSESLSRLLRRRGLLEPDEAAAIGLRLASILHSVHQAGYVHRDLKPEHVLLDRTEGGALRVSVLDFGVCASESAPLDEKDRERGRVFGTPSYVSPEQAGGNPDVDARADLYGLGVTLYESLTGELPFSASSVSALLRRILREEAPRVSHRMAGIPRVLDEVVAGLLRREKDHRFPSARAVGRALAPAVADRLAVERRLAQSLQVGAEAPEGVPTAEMVVAA